MATYSILSSALASQTGFLHASLKNGVKFQLNSKIKSATSNNKTLIFSGLIYNEKELKQKNEKQPLPLCLLELYEKEGIKAFLRINGKASIIIVEGTKTTVFRDHWGEGPLVFYSKSAIADSMKGILEIENEKADIDPVALKSFLRYGFIPAPLTLVKNIKKVPAGYVLIKDGDKEKFVNLYDYHEFKSKSINIGIEEAREEYDRLLKQSIKRRIGDHKTVGALLSGGYDSGGNIAVLRELFDGEIKSYSIGFKDNPFSELPYASLMAKEFGAKHHEYQMDYHDLDSLPEAIRAFGEPFTESGFMLNNAAMRLVKNEGLPVILGGDGNDQLFGTTGKELALNYLIKNNGLQFTQRAFQSLSRNKIFEKDNLAFKLRFHNNKILNVMKPDNFGMNDFLLNQIFHLNEVDEHPVFDALPVDYRNFTELHDQHNFYLDIRHSINEVIINKASRLSAYYGNNLGFTYIDKDIYDFVKQLPLSLRLKGELKDLARGKGVTKYLHKYYTKPKLPKEVTQRKKQGGFSPLSIFFDRTDLRQHIFTYILNSDFSKSFMKPEGLKAFLDQYNKNAKTQGYWFWFKQLQSNQLMNLLVISLWYDMYMNKKQGNIIGDFIY